MKIDLERLRQDLIRDNYGGYFVGGFGGALMEAFDIKKASPDEIVKIAQKKGVDLSRYITEN